jgi:hypothetical protein
MIPMSKSSTGRRIAARCGTESGGVDPAAPPRCSSARPTLGAAGTGAAAPALLTIRGGCFRPQVSQNAAFSAIVAPQAEQCRRVAGLIAMLRLTHVRLPA